MLKYIKLLLENHKRKYFIISKGSQELMPENEGKECLKILEKYIFKLQNRILENHKSLRLKITEQNP